MEKRRTITKKHLIQRISEERGIHLHDVGHVIQEFLDKITECLSQGDRLELRDFGIFEVVVRKSKIGRNPLKAAIPIVIPERAVVKFNAGKKLRFSLSNVKIGK